MKYFAIDIGSTYIKTALLDTEEGSISLFPVLENPPAVRRFGGRVYEVDVREVERIVRGQIDRMIDRYGAGSLAGVLFSTQMHGFLFTDKDGEAATPYISWQDTRSLLPHPQGGTWLEYLRRRIPPDMMRDSGVDLKAGLGMCNAFTLRQEGHYRISPGMRFATLGSYFIYRLTGRLACHITNAAPTGFADARHCDWNRNLISLTGFSDLVFPELVDERTPVGTYRGVAVYPDLGDQQCCVLGGLTRPEKDMNVNIGTGAQLCYIRSDYSFGPYECRPYLAGQFLPTITRLPGGRNLEVIMRFLKDTAETVSGMTITEQSVWEHMRSSADGARKSALDVSLGFFPETLGNAEGRIDNINDTNFTMGSLCAALYEKTAETYLQYYKKFTQEQDAFERLVFTGGVSRKDPLLTGSISAKIGLEKAVSPFRNEVFAGLYQIALVIDKKADSFDQTREIMEHSTIIWSGSR